MADSQRMETARRPEHGSFQKSGLKNMPEVRSYSNQCMHLHVAPAILLNRGSLPIRPLPFTGEPERVARRAGHGTLPADVIAFFCPSSRVTCLGKRGAACFSVLA